MYPKLWSIEYTVYCGFSIGNRTYGLGLHFWVLGPLGLESPILKVMIQAWRNLVPSHSYSSISSLAAVGASTTTNIIQLTPKSWNMGLGRFLPVFLLVWASRLWGWRTHSNFLASTVVRRGVARVMMPLVGSYR